MCAIIANTEFQCDISWNTGDHFQYTSEHYKWNTWCDFHEACLFLIGEVWPILCNKLHKLIFFVFLQANDQVEH